MNVITMQNIARKNSGVYLYDTTKINNPYTVL